MVLTPDRPLLHSLGDTALFCVQSINWILSWYSLPNAWASSKSKLWLANLKEHWERKQRKDGNRSNTKMPWNDLLDLSNYYYNTYLFIVWIFQLRQSYYVVVSASNLPASYAAKIAGMDHHFWLNSTFKGILALIQQDNSICPLLAAVVSCHIAGQHYLFWFRLLLDNVAFVAPRSCLLPPQNRTVTMLSVYPCRHCWCEAS